jgi:hypothetical protein
LLSDLTEAKAHIMRILTPKSYRSTLTKLAVCGALFYSPVLSFAATIAGNLGTSPGYDATIANQVGNDGAGDDVYQAAGFKLISSGIVSQYELALSCFSASACSSSVSNPLTVALTSDKSGAPGAVIESFTLNASTLTTFGSSAGNTGALITLNSKLDPLLVSGSTYWLEVTSDRNNMVVWYFNNSGDSRSSQALSLDGGVTWAGGLTPSAFQINGTLVPEPSSIGLVLGAGLLLSIFRKRRKA